MLPSGLARYAASLDFQATCARMTSSISLFLGPWPGCSGHTSIHRPGEDKRDVFWQWLVWDRVRRRPSRGRQGQEGGAENAGIAAKLGGSNMGLAGFRNAGSRASTGGKVAAFSEGGKHAGAKAARRRCASTMM